MEDWIHETCLISAVTSGPTEPKTFQEAWHMIRFYPKYQLLLVIAR